MLKKTDQYDLKWKLTSYFHLVEMIFVKIERSRIKEASNMKSDFNRSKALVLKEIHQRGMSIVLRINFN